MLRSHYNDQITRDLCRLTNHPIPAIGQGQSLAMKFEQSLASFFASAYSSYCLAHSLFSRSIWCAHIELCIYVLVESSKVMGCSLEVTSFDSLRVIAQTAFVCDAQGLVFDKSVAFYT